jgi:dTDP-glucose 4,6-dehydratase
MTGTFSNPLTEDLDGILARVPEVWEELRDARVFITGGTGFFGCWFLESLVHANARLGLGMRATVLSRNPERFRQKYPELAGNPAFTFLAGDVRDFAFPAGGFSHVIHAATQASAQLNEAAPLAMFDTIVYGTRRCLEFAAHCGAGGFLLTSSGAVYGRQPEDLPRVPETFAGGPDPLDPRSAYAEGKRAAELECALFARRGLAPKIARCFAFAGPYMNLDAHFAIGNFIRDQLQGGPIRVSGDGHPVRSYMYAADLMVWLWTILQRGTPGRAYNVGAEEAVSIAQLAHLVADALSPRVAVEIAGKPNRAGAADYYVPCTARAREELGVCCYTPLRETVQRTQAWFVRKPAAYS